MGGRAPSGQLSVHLIQVGDVEIISQCLNFCIGFSIERVYCLVRLLIGREGRKEGRKEGSSIFVNAFFVFLVSLSEFLLHPAHLFPCVMFGGCGGDDGGGDFLSRLFLPPSRQTRSRFCGICVHGMCGHAACLGLLPSCPSG